eukprot:70794_1
MSAGQTKDMEISKELDDGRDRAAKVLKALFLGGSRSGKTALFKQLMVSRSKYDRLKFVGPIHAQIIEQMQLAIECAQFLAEDELLNEHGDDYKKPDDFNPLSKLSEDAQAA